MILVIISSIVCFCMTIIMYTHKMRIFAFYRPLAWLFLFEGIWILLDYIFRQIFPDNVFMQIIHYIGIIVLGIYFMASIIISAKQKPSKKRKLHTKE